MITNQIRNLGTKHYKDKLFQSIKYTSRLPLVPNINLMQNKWRLTCDEGVGWGRVRV